MTKTDIIIRNCAERLLNELRDLTDEVLEEEESEAIRLAADLERYKIYSDTITAYVDTLTRQAFSDYTNYQFFDDPKTNEARAQYEILSRVRCRLWNEKRRLENEKGKV